MIEFYSYEFNTHSSKNAQVIRQAPARHENHFGAYVSNKRFADNNVYIESVEHAQSLIAALQQAIDTGMLLPMATIRRHYTPHSNTLEDIRQSMRRNKE